MKKELYFVAFITGAVIGSAITWRCVKTKYEKIAQEEIDSVKEVFAKKVDCSQPEKKSVNGLANEIIQVAEQAREKPDMKQYTALLQNTGYTAGINGERSDGTMDNNHPYVISPEEFGEFDDYEQVSLTYYADGILADDNDEVVEDVEVLVGEALDHFGEYEDDSVFVRCDERRCDYEILLDQRKFSEVIDGEPGQVEV